MLHDAVEHRRRRSMTLQARKALGDLFLGPYPLQGWSVRIGWEAQIGFAAKAGHSALSPSRSSLPKAASPESGSLSALIDERLDS
jgi:hypothetical protein